MPSAEAACISERFGVDTTVPFQHRPGSFTMWLMTGGIYLLVLLLSASCEALIRRNPGQGNMPPGEQLGALG